MTFVVKASGEHQEFSEEKILASIQRAGIPQNLHHQVLSHVKEKLHDGMPTSQIYHHIIEFLDATHPYSKSKYSLKESLMQLGPTGYPFEKFLARLLEKEDYITKTNQLIHGRCVVHEVDVVAQNGNKKIMVEAKFHNTNGIKTDLHVSLYTKARFEDIAQKNEFTHAMLITNTKATVDAIAYAQCVDLEVITWGYPEGKGLRELVEKYHLHPITSLHTLSQSQKQQLLEQNIVLCKDLIENQSILSSFNFSPDKMKSIVEEASFISSHQNS